MSMNFWLKCGLVGLGLWVVGVLYSGIFGPILALHSILATLSLPIHWLLFGFVAIKLVDMVK